MHVYSKFKGILHVLILSVLGFSAGGVTLAKADDSVPTAGATAADSAVSSNAEFLEFAEGAAVGDFIYKACNTTNTIVCIAITMADFANTYGYVPTNCGTEFINWWLYGWCYP